MKIWKIAESPKHIEVEKLITFLTDPNLQDLSCVYNAKCKLPDDFYGAIKVLRVDADKIRMINRELYDYINDIALPMSQEQLDKWHRIWDKQEGKK